jgi:galactose mutarotase-like enzyme
MNIFSLENSYILAKFRDLGGELIELYDKKTQTHRLKRGEQHWSWYSPTLFPLVGRTHQDTLKIHRSTA